MNVLLVLKKKKKGDGTVMGRVGCGKQGRPALRLALPSASVGREPRLRRLDAKWVPSTARLFIIHKLPSADLFPEP